MSKMLTHLLLLYCNFAIISAQISSYGNCPKVDTIKEFELSKYVGKWYENQKYLTIFEFDGRCITTEYSATNETAIKLKNHQVDRRGLHFEIKGFAVARNPEEKAKLTVIFPSLPSKFTVRIPAPYWILGTDYDNYAVVWSCVEVLFFNLQYAWILTRERNPGQEIIDEARAVFKSNNLSLTNLLKTPQNNCNKL